MKFFLESVLKKAVWVAFEDWYGKGVKGSDSIASLGGDSFDVVEIALLIEMELVIDDLDDSFVEEKISKLSIDQIVEELVNYFNTREE